MTLRDIAERSIATSHPDHSVNRLRIDEVEVDSDLTTVNVSALLIPNEIEIRFAVEPSISDEPTV